MHKGPRRRPMLAPEIDVGCKEPEKIKTRRKRWSNMLVRIGSSRIVDPMFSMPPSLPMVFLTRSYVRAVRMPLSGWGIGRGRSANLALDERDCCSAG